MHVADALSRASSNADNIELDSSLNKTVHTINVSEEVQNLIMSETENDSVLQQLKFYYENGWPKCKNKVADTVKFYYKCRDIITYENGIVYLDYKIIVPLVLRDRVIKKVHSSHFGINKTIARAKSLFYWPSLETDFINIISKCITCEKYSAKKSKEPMLLDDIPTLPFQKIACDFLQWNSKTYLIVTDYYSKWFDLIHVNSLTASTVINILKNIFSTHGIPGILRADNMPFNSFEFQNFATLWNIKLITSSPKYPRSNGFVERFVGIAKNLLNKSTEAGVDFQEVLLEYRNTPVLGSQYSPSQLLFSRLTRTKLPIHDELLKPKLVTDFNETQNKVNTNNKRNFDKTAKYNKHTFYSGQDVVYLRDNVWVPANVIDIHSSPRSLILKDKNGQILRRNTLHIKPSFHKDENVQWKEIVNRSMERRSYSQDVMGDAQDVVEDAQDVVEDAQEQERNLEVRPRRNIVPPKHLGDYVCYK